MVDADDRAGVGDPGMSPDVDMSPDLFSKKTVESPSEPKVMAGAERSLLDEAGPLTQKQAVSALELLRDSVIAPSIQGWEPERSLLRPAMIETFVRQRIVDTEDWSKKVPMYLRQGTDPLEKKRYLDRVCEVIERII